MPEDSYWAKEYEIQRRELSSMKIGKFIESTLPAREGRPSHRTATMTRYVELDRFNPLSRFELAYWVVKYMNAALKVRGYFTTNIHASARTRIGEEEPDVIPKKVHLQILIWENISEDKDT